MVHEQQSCLCWIFFVNIIIAVTKLESVFICKVLND